MRGRRIFLLPLPAPPVPPPLQYYFLSLVVNIFSFHCASFCHFFSLSVQYFTSFSVSLPLFSFLSLFILCHLLIYLSMSLHCFSFSTAIFFFSQLLSASRTVFLCSPSSLSYLFPSSFTLFSLSPNLHFSFPFNFIPMPLFSIIFSYVLLHLFSVPSLPSFRLPLFLLH